MGGVGGRGGSDTWEKLPNNPVFFLSRPSQKNCDDDDDCDDDADDKKDDYSGGWSLFS